MKRKDKILLMFLLVSSLIIGSTIIILLKEIDSFDFPDNNSIIPSVESVDDSFKKGETVLTEINFNYQLMDFDSFERVSSSTQPDTFYESSRENCYENDESVYLNFMYWSVGRTSEIAIYYAKIYCGGSGILQHEIYLYAGGGYSNEGSTNYQIENSNLDNQGYLVIYWDVDIDCSTEEMDLSFGFVDVLTQTRIEIFAVDEVGSPLSTITQFIWYIDTLNFLQDTIENIIKSDYKYSSDTIIIHSLEIFSIQYAKEIIIYSPIIWKFISINPNVIVEKVSDNYIINSPIELTYEMLFKSEHNYLLGIEETTLNYLTDVSFENGENNCFDIGGEMDSLLLVQNITSDGYHSLMLVDSDGSTENLRIKTIYELPTNTYYISFDIYIESFSGTNLQFQYFDFSDSLIEKNFNISILKRWQKCFYSIEYLHEGNFIYPIEFSFAQGIVFFDNFRIFQTSTKIETIDLNKYEISVKFISWDGYDNSIIKNELVYVKLLDRTYPEKPFFTIEGLTNNVGIFSFIYNEVLEQKEYEVFSYARNSWFNCQWDKDYLKESSSWDFSFYGTVIKTITDEYAYFYTDHLDTHDLEYYYLVYDITKWDLSENNIILFDIKNDVNSQFNSLYIRKSWSAETIRNTMNLRGINEWNSFNFWYDNDYCYVNNENPYDDFLAGVDFNDGDLEEIAKIHFADFNFTNNPTNFYIRNLHTTLATNFYFTPTYSYYNNLIKIVADYEWDFSIKNARGWDYRYEVTIVNGYMYKELDYQRFQNLFTEFEPNDLDLTNYDYLIIRYKTNVSDWFLKTDKGFDYNYNFNGNGNWNIKKWDLLEEYKTVIDYFSIRTLYPSYIYIDYIKIVSESNIILNSFDNYFMIESENNKLNYSVFLDEIFIGFYQDLDFIIRDNSIGNHNLTYIPFSNNNSHAFLIGDIYEYLYQSVNETFNYFTSLGFDYDLGNEIFYSSITTFYGDCFIRVAQNTTWLGSVQNEGLTVWSFIYSYGYHIFDIYVYNNDMSLFDILQTSITIVEPVLVFREITFNFYSLVDGLGLPDNLLKIYVNDSSSNNYLRKGSSDIILCETTFGLRVQDYYNNVAYENESMVYSKFIDIGLTFYKVFIWNNLTNINESIAVMIELTNNQTTFDYSLMAKYQMIELRLLSKNYSVIVKPEKYYSDDWNYRYYDTEFNIEVNSSQTNFQIGVYAEKILDVESSVFFPTMKEAFNYLLICGSFLFLTINIRRNFHEYVKGHVGIILGMLILLSITVLVISENWRYGLVAFILPIISYFLVGYFMGDMKVKIGEN